MAMKTNLDVLNPGNIRSTDPAKIGAIPQL